MTNPILSKGGKRKGSKKRQNRNYNQKYNQNYNQNYNQQQNQQGGAYGNSSTVAAGYGGNVPMNMPPQQGGSALASSNYNNGGNVNLVRGGANIIPQMGGNAFIKGGNATVPLPGMPPATTGGNVLNELAVPAVLLYANNTFGKKKRFTGRKFRRSGKKSRRVRRR